MENEDIINQGVGTGMCTGLNFTKSPPGIPKKAKKGCNCDSNPWKKTEVVKNPVSNTADRVSVFYRVSASEGQGVFWAKLCVCVITDRGRITVMDIYRLKYMIWKQWDTTKADNWELIKTHSCGGMEGRGISRGDEKRRLLSLSVLCSALSVQQTCRWRGGGSDGRGVSCI